MGKTNDYEGIRRGLNILSIVGRAGLSHQDILSKLAQDGTEVDIRTIERQCKKLVDQFPNLIEVNDSTIPYTYRQPRNARKYSAMNPQEAVCLQLAFTYLSPLLPNRTFDDINPYLKEATAVLKESSATRMRNWRNKVMTVNEGIQLKQAKIKKGILETIHEALWTDRVISASYQSRKKSSPSKYILHPGGLVFRGRICYLVCSFENDDKKIPYLPLNRFHSVKIIQEELSRHKKDKIENLAKDLMGFKLDDKKIKVKLKFSISSGTHLYETPLSDNQKISKSRDGFIIVEDTVVNNLEFKWWIRAFGDSVEVISPASLRKEFKTTAKRMLKLYE